MPNTTSEDTRLRLWREAWRKAVAERDAALARAKELQDSEDDLALQRAVLKVERDAAIARAERAEAALREIEQQAADGALETGDKRYREIHRLATTPTEEPRRNTLYDNSATADSVTSASRRFEVELAPTEEPEP